MLPAISADDGPGPLARAGPLLARWRSLRCSRRYQRMTALVRWRAPVRSWLAGARCDAPGAVSGRWPWSAGARRSAPGSLALAAMLPALSADDGPGPLARAGP